MSNEKRIYLSRLQNMMTGLASQIHILEDLEAVYNARQYGAGGANAITEVELAEVEMTPNDLALAIFLAANLTKFLKGEETTPASYINILNELRTDI